MHLLTSFKKREIESALTSKGFLPTNTDHEYFFFYVDGKKTSVWTKLSFGDKEYGDPLLGQIKKQLHLTKGELIDLIECPLTEEMFRKKMIENGFVKL